MATPRKPRRAVREQAAPPMPAEHMALLNALPWPEGGNEFARNAFHADAKNIWREWRTSVVAQYAARFRGRRPPLWWWFDAPEPRLRLAGVGVEAPHADWRGEVWRWCGYPVGWLMVDRFDPPTFESQAAYLGRLGLLLRGEAARLYLDDLAPEPLPEEFWPRA